MASKVDKLRVGKEYDRRRRLTDEQRDELIQAKGTMSQQQEGDTLNDS